ncbi:hypothetical protein Emtol_1192 [Emticicia oligotrophica DSM 17448]|uniref:GLPGLI family protein n=1 Tax=Emticicia oligotrophica (strain DSM 17448 / CIP 109782 / MTCC 6937 / GPTSA100-15) TaxID=929562 RepID=A0ABN4AKL2_EMTOG|nr:hypothetical protein [Emticicia oligotrophica]AFK02341.1 hypothetical protein Emtol_1192 [Emticicia oligotrophica DSM 17448]
MKIAVLFLLFIGFTITGFAQTSTDITETIYRSFYNETVTIKPENPDKAIKRRYCIFIDTTQSSIFSKNLEQSIELDDYYQSIVYRHCRNFKASKKLNQLWSFKDDSLFQSLPQKWFEAQELNNKTYIFCPKSIRGHYSFHLSDSTIVVTKGEGPETHFIKTVKKLQNSIMIDCFQGSKFTIKILDTKTQLAIWKIEDNIYEHSVIYRLSVPVNSFKYYHKIVNHSIEDKIPDDLVFDEIDFEDILSFTGKMKARF